MSSKLTEIANRLGTDKGTEQLNRHGYTEKYPRYIPESASKILEIGVRFGPSVRMWAEYYPNINTIYGLDFCVEITPEQLKSIQDENKKFKFFYADQSNRSHLKEVVNTIRDNQLDFILDDGSHCTDHQQISLANLFRLVKPSGIYIIEDLNDINLPKNTWITPEVLSRYNIKDTVNFTDATMYVLKKFNETGKIVSPFLTPDECTQLELSIEKVIIEEELENSFAVIYKK